MLVVSNICCHAVYHTGRRPSDALDGVAPVIAARRPELDPVQEGTLNTGLQHRESYRQVSPPKRPRVPALQSGFLNDPDRKGDEVDNDAVDNGNHADFQSAEKHIGRD